MEQFFFFSSRRRHTRWNCDWSSDVCSSDLGLVAAELVAVGVDRQLLVQGDLREVLGERRSGGHVARLARSEEHTSELQSQFHLVCRLLLEKKKKKTQHSRSITGANR